MTTILPPDSLLEDLEELRWQEFEARRRKRMDDDCGYVPPPEDSEDE